MTLSFIHIFISILQSILLYWVCNFTSSTELRLFYIIFVKALTLNLGRFFNNRCKLVLKNTIGKTDNKLYCIVSQDAFRFHLASPQNFSGAQQARTAFWVPQLVVVNFLQRLRDPSEIIGRGGLRYLSTREA